MTNCQYGDVDTDLHKLALPHAKLAITVKSIFSCYILVVNDSIWHFYCVEMPAKITFLLFQLKVTG